MGYVIKVTLVIHRVIHRGPGSMTGHGLGSLGRVAYVWSWVGGYRQGRLRLVMSRGMGGVAQDWSLVIHRIPGKCGAHHIRHAVFVLDFLTFLW